MQPDLEKQDENRRNSPEDEDGSLELAGMSAEKDSEAEDGCSKNGASIHAHTANDPIDPISDEPQSASQSRKINTSVQSRQLNVVPRSQRRGLLARFTLIPEVERPHDYDGKTKWTITLVVALAAAAGPMGSAIFYPALPELSKDLHASATVTNLTVAIYMLSMAIFPLWWSSFSETLGRRTIYLVSFLLCVVFNALSAVSTSIGMLTAMRALGGGAAASVQSVGAGTIADIWEPKERGKAMGIFYLGPLCGPLLAPIVGGALAQKLGWRSTMWFLTIYAGVLVVTLTFCLPETLHPQAVAPSVPVATDERGIQSQLSRVSTRQSVKIKTRSFALVFKRCILDPLSVLLYLRFPAVLLTVYLASITFGCLYILNISVQQAFSDSPYNYSIIIVGLLYIPTSLGYVAASLLGGRWNDYIMHREARRANRYDESGKLILRPEDRVGENAWLAAVMYPGALLWYGWSVDKGLPWIVSAIANFFFGVGSMIIFGTATTMLTEFMPKKSSSGVATNNFVRNIFSCIGGIVAAPLIDALGTGWLFTGLAVICWISALGVVWALKRFGPHWRKDMDEKIKNM